MLTKLIPKTIKISNIIQKRWSQMAKNNRPMSPHLTIYKFPLPAIMSIAHRITGAGLGIGNVNSKLMENSIKTLPKSIKTLGKFTLAFPFMYHNINGVRHLIWDSTAKSLTVKSLYSSGYSIIGLSAVSSLALASK